MAKNLSIAFVRRGYSPTGGAEVYLKRLAHGVAAAGHDAQLIATDDWPDHEWPFGSIMRVRAGSVVGFANELKQIRPRLACDVLLDRKSTRLNSSHSQISYAVFCLKKKNYNTS